MVQFHLRVPYCNMKYLVNTESVSYRISRTADNFPFDTPSGRGFSVASTASKNSLHITYLTYTILLRRLTGGLKD